MNKAQKAVSLGGITGLSINGVVETIDYLWSFTSLPPLPDATSLMVAGLLSAVIYSMLPKSTPQKPKEGP